MRIHLPAWIRTSSLAGRKPGAAAVNSRPPHVKLGAALLAGVLLILAAPSEAQATLEDRDYGMGGRMWEEGIIGASVSSARYASPGARKRVTYICVSIGASSTRDDGCAELAPEVDSTLTTGTIKAMIPSSIYPGSMISVDVRTQGLSAIPYTSGPHIATLATIPWFCWPGIFWWGWYSCDYLRVLKDPSVQVHPPGVSTYLYKHGGLVGSISSPKVGTVRVAENGPSTGAVGRSTIWEGYSVGAGTPWNGGY